MKCHEHMPEKRALVEDRQQKEAKPTVSGRTSRSIPDEPLVLTS
jgi:hypothetical protein